MNCRRCGIVVVEKVPWGDGKRWLTKAYVLFLARWARRRSWKEPAFRTSWDGCSTPSNRSSPGVWNTESWGQIDAIDVDETQYARATNT